MNKTIFALFSASSLISVLNASSTVQTKSASVSETVKDTLSQQVDQGKKAAAFQHEISKQQAEKYSGFGSFGIPDQVFGVPEVMLLDLSGVEKSSETVKKSASETVKDTLSQQIDQGKKAAAFQHEISKQQAEKYSGFGSFGIPNQVSGVPNLSFLDISGNEEQGVWEEEAAEEEETIPKEIQDLIEHYKKEASKYKEQYSKQVGSKDSDKDGSSQSFLKEYAEKYMNSQKEEKSTKKASDLILLALSGSEESNEEQGVWEEEAAEEEETIPKEIQEMIAHYKEEASKYKEQYSKKESSKDSDKDGADKSFLDYAKQYYKSEKEEKSTKKVSDMILLALSGFEDSNEEYGAGEEEAYEGCEEEAAEEEETIPKEIQEMIAHYKEEASKYKEQYSKKESSKDSDKDGADKSFLDYAKQYYKSEKGWKSTDKAGKGFIFSF